jgi:hypothetical protein
MNSHFETNISSSGKRRNGKGVEGSGGGTFYAIPALISID